MLGTSAGTFHSLFDRVSLAGWHAVPRSPVSVGPGWPDPDPADAHWHLSAANQAAWTVVDGAIVGGQNPPGSGYGGYLVSDEAFGDFELVLEANPDWPADTGILVRATPAGTQGYQILLDHRKSGGIGGLFGNGIGAFHAVRFGIDAVYDDAGAPIGIREEDPATTIEPVTPAKAALLSRSATAEEFLAVWRWRDWNEFRIQCVGEDPVLTVWINGLLIAECDTATLPPDLYDPPAVHALLGRAGRIALEVHDHDIWLPPGIGSRDLKPLGRDRWGLGAVCRWRNLRLRAL
jgi:hypothetical protein